MPVQVEFSGKGERTQLILVCNDRPGLLAQVASVLHSHKVRVHDARIATFGERVEDFFELSDARNAPLSPPQCETLAAALRESVALG